MAKQTIQEKIKALKKVWKNTKAKEPYEDLPNGDFEGIIKNAVQTLAKETNNLMAVYTLEVTAPEDFKGRLQYKRQMLETEDNVSYAKGDLKAINVVVDDIDELGDTFEQEVVGLPILFSVVHNKEFVNVYFRERLEGEKQESEPDKDADNGDEEALTADDVRGYLDEDDEGESIFAEIIKDNELDINPDEYATWSEVADLIIDQLDLE